MKSLMLALIALLSIATTAPARSELKDHGQRLKRHIEVFDQIHAESAGGYTKWKAAVYRWQIRAIVRQINGMVRECSLLELISTEGDWRRGRAIVLRGLTGRIREIELLLTSGRLDEILARLSRDEPFRTALETTAEDLDALAGYYRSLLSRVRGG